MIETKTTLSQSSNTINPSFLSQSNLSRYKSAFLKRQDETPKVKESHKRRKRGLLEQFDPFQLPPHINDLYLQAATRLLTGMISKSDSERHLAEYGPGTARPVHVFNLDTKKKGRFSSKF